jgi:thiosulfate/3-mercaptopyruvate sulfurtransferase
MLIPPLITADELYRRIDDRDIKIVDCRFSLADTQLGEGQYRAQHIIGADYLHLDRDLSSPTLEHGGRHPLPNLDRLAAKLGEIGIERDRTFVVAYDDSRGAFASRLWWLLRYYGHDRVAVLDGGYAGWVKAGYPTTEAIDSTPASTQFLPQIRSTMMVDIATVKSIDSNSEHTLIDAREVDRFLGNIEPIDPVAGAIPHAVNYPWQDCTTPAGNFLPVEFHRQRWQTIAPQPDLAIVYCGSGVTACVNLLSMAIAGIDGAKLYPGGWSDWCSYLQS